VPLAVPFEARAGTVFTQLPDFLINPSGSGQEQVVSSTLDNFGNLPGFRAADNFQLAAPASIADVAWWGKPLAGGDNFTFTFYADNRGLPGSVLATTGGGPLTITPIPGLGLPADLFATTLNTPFQAQAGITYWLSIFDAGPTASWRWEESVGGSYTVTAAPPGNAWGSVDQNNLAFSLASVPEPASLTLFSASALSLLWYRRRQKNWIGR
jgi:hypothetical protein